MSYKKVTQFIIEFVEEYNLYDLVEANAALATLVDYIGKRRRPDLYPELQEPVKGRCAMLQSECLHEHITCPGNSETMKCAYCDKKVG